MIQKRKLQDNIIERDLTYEGILLLFFSNLITKDFCIELLKDNVSTFTVQEKCDLYEKDFMSFDESEITFGEDEEFDVELFNSTKIVSFLRSINKLQEAIKHSNLYYLLMNIDFCNMLESNEIEILSKDVRIANSMRLQQLFYIRFENEKCASDVIQVTKKSCLSDFTMKLAIKAKKPLDEISIYENGKLLPLLNYLVTKKGKSFETVFSSIKNNVNINFLLHENIILPWRVNFLIHELLTPENTFYLNDQNQSVLFFKTDIDVISQLLPYVNINQQDQFGCTALHYARDFDVIKYLFEHGALKEIRNNRGETPLMRFVRNCCSEEIIKYCIDIGCDAKAKDYKGNCMIYTIENTNICQLFLNAGVDINVRNGMDRTLLHGISIRPFNDDYCYNNILLFLYNHGINVNAIDCYFNTALHYGNLRFGSNVLSIFSSVNLAMVNELGETPMNTEEKMSAFLPYLKDTTNDVIILS